jgi:hypothetical protein
MKRLRITVHRMAITGRSGSTVECSSAPVPGITEGASTAMWITPSTTAKDIGDRFLHAARLQRHNVCHFAARLCTIHEGTKLRAIADSCSALVAGYQGI